MPVFTMTIDLACPPETVWEFLIRPAHLVQVSPPDLNLQLTEGPEVLQLGSRVTLTGRRLGMSQRIVNEVTRYTPGLLFIEEQREGPLRKWIHTHCLEPTATGTRMTDTIEFEPPGGMLGFLVTASRIQKELEEVFEYRGRRIRELLEKGR